MCEAIKETQTKCCLLWKSIQQLAVFYTWASGSVSVSNRDDTNSTSQASEELNYTPTWPNRQLLQNHTLAISHDVELHVELHAYNTSGQLVSSVKGTHACRKSKRKEGYASWHGKSVPA